jgi:hypothetical protein
MDLTVADQTVPVFGTMIVLKVSRLGFGADAGTARPAATAYGGAPAAAAARRVDRPAAAPAAAPSAATGNLLGEVVPPSPVPAAAPAAAAPAASAAGSSGQDLLFNLADDSSTSASKPATSTFDPFNHAQIGRSGIAELGATGIGGGSAGGTPMTTPVSSGLTPFPAAMGGGGAPGAAWSMNPSPRGMTGGMPGGMPGGMTGGMPGGMAGGMTPGMQGYPRPGRPPMGYHTGRPF